MALRVGPTYSWIARIFYHVVDTLIRKAEENISKTSCCFVSHEISNELIKQFKTD